MLKAAKDLEPGDRIPSNMGTFTVTGLTTGKRGQVTVSTAEETPEGGCFIKFAAGEVVEVEPGKDK